MSSLSDSLARFRRRQRRRAIQFRCLMAGLIVLVVVCAGVLAMLVLLAMETWRGG